MLFLPEVIKITNLFWAFLKMVYNKRKKSKRISPPMHLHTHTAHTNTHTDTLSTHKHTCRHVNEDTQVRDSYIA